MELIMTINVKTFEALEVRSSASKVVMIPFCAETEGELFTGKTIQNGVDTQYTDAQGRWTVSARYMMQGHDLTGAPCRIFIENCGTSLDDCVPRIVTDSPALAYLQSRQLRAKVTPCPEGVTVSIYG
ncbi:MAG: hypothetical protein IJ129_05460 [Ruminococcus sp.]|nr:hypothetical protein [Ruminococcus sp.]